MSPDRLHIWSMKPPEHMTLQHLLSILERLNPESLLLVRGETGLDDQLLAELFRKVAFSIDPERRLANLEYILLIMHDARRLDARRYVRDVFLPFTGIQRRLEAQIRRILDEIAASDRFEEGSREDAAHQATKVYRPLVADVFDPYLTLLVATYQFIEGTFVDIGAANLGMGERSKSDFVAARIHAYGGPAGLMDGYDRVVRNALSHPGSDGIVYEDGSVLFRSFARRKKPKVETRRWFNDELYRRGTALMEFAMSIDAACEVFGIDNMDLLQTPEMRPHFLDHAASRAERLAILRDTDERLDRIRHSQDAPLAERRDRMGTILLANLRERGMPCGGLGFADREAAVSVLVPIDANAEDEVGNARQAASLIRYLILARAVFGSLYGRYLAHARLGDEEVMVVETPAAALKDYFEERAGLLDLLAESEIHTRSGKLSVTLDLAAIEAYEDETLAPHRPRRGRPSSD